MRDERKCKRLRKSCIARHPPKELTRLEKKRFQIIPKLRNGILDGRGAFFTEDLPAVGASATRA
jgi:hypothetical protein